MRLRIALGIYIVVLAIVGYYPRPVDSGVHGQLYEVIRWLDRHHLAFISYARVEFTANILLFIPLGVLLALIFGTHRWWIAPLICLAASGAIEIGQGLFLPHRFASVGDVIANTIGGFLGSVIAMLAQRGRDSMRRRKNSRYAR